MQLAFRVSLFLLGFLYSIAADAQPPNDNFANRIPVQPSVPFDGSVAGATFESLDPLPPYRFFPARTNGSIWWTWTPPTTGFAVIIDAKNGYGPGLTGFDSLAVFQGDDLATLRDPVWVFLSAIFQPLIGGPKPFLGFPTTAGSPVSIGLVGEATREFTHTFHMSFSENPIIVEAPASQTNFAGGAVAFRFMSPSYRFGHAQWQFNSQNIPNATNAVLFLSDIRPSDAGEYRVVIEATNSAGILKQTISPAATLTVVGDVVPATLSIQRASGSNSEFLLNILGTTNQWYSIDRTSDFTNWFPVEIPEWANNVKRGETPIVQLASAEFMRVRHRGNLDELCVQHLRQIHFAKELLRFAYHKWGGEYIDPADLKEFLGELPQCPLGGAYYFAPMDTAPDCLWHDAYAGIWP